MSVVTRLDTSRLDELTAETRPRASRIVKETGFEAQGLAQMLAPKDTSALANSLMFEMTSELSGLLHDGVEYGIFQELGTSKMAAQPFMTPAIEAKRQDFTGRWAELFE